ncbi:Channel-forming transporter/cytolysins activator of TpsB family [Pectobacterium sp. F1-1]|nr:Channel-forming transporter/cytolysins activator of TpsB family [Pectobacterium sp. F1-1]
MRGFFRLILITPALFFCTAFSAFSAQLNPADQKDIQQWQAEVIDQSRQQRDLLLQLNQPQMTMNPVGESNTGYCLSIQEIHYHKSSLLRESDKDQLNKSHINRCINVNNINLLVYDGSNKYIKQGYITNLTTPL